MNRVLALRKLLRLTQAQMAAELSISPRAYRDIEKGKKRISEEIQSILAEKLHINPAWLTSGEGDPLMRTRPAEPSNPNSHATSKMLNQRQGNSVFSSSDRDNGEIFPRFYNLPVFVDHEFPSATVKIPSPFLTDYLGQYINYTGNPFHGCTFFRPVMGVSMSPKFNSGDVIACQKMSADAPLIYGETYLCLIRHENGYHEVLRTVRKCETRPQSVCLRAVNPRFEEVVVSREAVVEVYLVKGRFEKHI